MLSGKSEVNISLPQGAPFSQAVAELAKQYPPLVGEIIQKDGRTLIDTNLFSLNGEKILHSSDMEGTPRNGDTLILLSLLAGG